MANIKHVGRSHTKPDNAPDPLGHAMSSAPPPGGSRASWIGAVPGGVLIGLVAGWCLGSWATCGNTCEFDVALFEALGTWVGGVGVAAIAGGYALSRSTRDRAAALETAEHDALVLARGCVIRFVPIGDEHNGYRRLSLVFNNTLSEKVHAVSLHASDGSSLQEDAQVNPSRSWGTAINYSDLGLADHYASVRLAQQAVTRVIKERIVFRYTIRGFAFERTGNSIVITTRPTRPQKAAT